MANKWDRPAMRFASAKFREQEGMLDVTFENGDHFLLAVETVLTGVRGAAIGDPSVPRAASAPSVAPLVWGKMRIGETGDVLEVPADDTIIEIPWDRIRAIADADFRAHLAERAHERARHIGRRVRAMRLEAGLTPAAIAEKVGVPHHVITNLEAGKIEPQIDLIQHIAGVLGRRLKDFVEE